MPYYSQVNPPVSQFFAQPSYGQLVGGAVNLWQSMSFHFYKDSFSSSIIILNSIYSL